MSQVDVHDHGRSLALTHGAWTARFHAVWLRDNAWNDATRAPAAGGDNMVVDGFAAALRAGAPEAAE